MVFTGAATALVTPFNEDMTVNYRKFEQLAEFQIENGISALVVCGTTGEGSTLSDEEQRLLLETAIGVSNGRVPVIAGVSSNDTMHAVRLADSAREAGADAVLALTPYYNKTSQNGLVRHFAAIAQAAEIPVILYNVPSRTGMSISAPTYMKLSAIRNIVGVKDAGGNVSESIKDLVACAGDLSFYSGNDDLTLPMLSIGAKGVVSVLSNLLPREVSDICRLFFEGKNEDARCLQLRYAQLTAELFAEVNPIPIKYALNYLGFDVGPCRLPLVELGHDKRFLLEILLNKLQA